MSWPYYESWAQERASYNADLETLCARCETGKIPEADVVYYYICCDCVTEEEDDKSEDTHA